MRFTKTTCFRNFGADFHFGQNKESSMSPSITVQDQSHPSKTIAKWSSSSQTAHYRNTTAQSYGYFLKQQVSSF